MNKSQNGAVARETNEGIDSSQGVVKVNQCTGRRKSYSRCANPGRDGMLADLLLAKNVDLSHPICNAFANEEVDREAGQT